MTNYVDETRLADDVPAADAGEQRQPVEVRAEDAGLDPDYVANLVQRDANAPDVIDQAITVPMPDDDRDVDTNAARVKSCTPLGVLMNARGTESTAVHPR